MLSGFNYHQPTALRFGAGRVTPVATPVESCYDMIVAP